jgi:hypothetical protein
MIVEALEEGPPVMDAKALGDALDVTPQTVRYNIDDALYTGRVRKMKVGRTTAYYLQERDDELDAQERAAVADGDETHVEKLASRLEEAFFNLEAVFVGLTLVSIILLPEFISLFAASAVSFGVLWMLVKFFMDTGLAQRIGVKYERARGRVPWSLPDWSIDAEPNATGGEQ